MLTIRHSIWLAIPAAATSTAPLALSQDFPSRPLRIVTGGTGGGNDFVARLIGQGLSASVGQQVIVDNRPSAFIAAETVARAPADGYIMLVTASSFWIAPLLQKTYADPLRDLSPLTLTSSSPQILVVHPSLPARSVTALIALAKARPGELNFAAGPLGSTPHLAGELFKSMAGVKITAIPYKGAGPGITDLIGGQVQLMFATPGGVVPHVKSGRLRALAVTSAQPSALLPGLPAVAQSGLPKYEAVGLLGMFVPVKTPAPIISRLNQEIVDVLNTADVREKLLASGVEAVGSTPEQFAATIKSDVALWSKVIKEAGIRAD